MKRREKSYNPKRRTGNKLAGIDALAFNFQKRLDVTLDRINAEADQRTLEEDQIQSLSVFNHAAMVDMVSGRACEESWEVIGYALNMSLILAEAGIGEEIIPLLKEAQEGVVRAQQRVMGGGNWGFDGPAIAAINVALDLHDQQMRIAKKVEVREAIAEINNRVKTGVVYN